MKKFVTMALSLLLTASVMTGCGRRTVDQSTNTTTTHTTISTTHATDSTMPSDRAIPKEIPEISSAPSVGNDNNDNSGKIGKSNTHRKLPRANIGNR